MAHTHVLERTQEVHRALPEVFAFFADAANLEALTPHFLHFHILSPRPIEMRPGTQIDYALSLFGIPLHWRSRIMVWEPGVRFVDEQAAGPYAVWRHTHSFEAHGDSTVVRDKVEYREPLGPAGELAHILFVEHTLRRIFDYRREATRRLLEGGEAKFAAA